MRLYPKLNFRSVRPIALIFAAIPLLGSAEWREWLSLPLSFDEGEASYYADAFEGRRTASGVLFHQEESTAAHRTWPFGTIVRVVSLLDERETVVTITDRGPFRPTRVIDLSRSAADRLGMLRRGVLCVRIEVLQWGPGGPPPSLQAPDEVTRN